MGNSKFDVDRYDYSLELKAADQGVSSKIFASISLFSTGKNVADLRFLKPGELAERNYFAGDQLNIDLVYEKLAPIVDMLRNEKPLRLLVWHGGTNDEPTNIEARLDTGLLEEVGHH